MVDFLIVASRYVKKDDYTEVYPKFKIMKSKDLMVRGSDFYAIWDEGRGFWSTDENDAVNIIDRELEKYTEDKKDSLRGQVRIKYMWDSETCSIDKFHRYCQHQCRDNFHMLDTNILFANTVVKKEDYASKTLKYPIEKGSLEGYETLMSVLYSPEERKKIEWAIGAIITGASIHIQKFMVFYGSAGTGKSTVLNLIQKLFDGYHTVFDAKALGSNGNAFAMSVFKENPLIAIQHDGDLSRIEDNTRLNSLVSHELMTVSEKYKSEYAAEFKTFLFMGTNKPVKITDARSGIIRRLIDVSPSGHTVPKGEYDSAVKKLDFELGAIAHHCMGVFMNNRNIYDDYIPKTMLSATNDFYNFMWNSYFDFKRDDGVTLNVAWKKYKQFCEETDVKYPLSQRIFKEELSNYFWEFKDRARVKGTNERIRNYYKGFKWEKFENTDVLESKELEEYNVDLIEFSEQESIFEIEAADYIAQLAKGDESPTDYWINIQTTLKDIDTSKLHYVKVPENHIVIDFDIPDEYGNKSLEKNLKAASEWPETYAELSKSGQGIHLHYIYQGDPKLLSRVYGDHIEIKVFTGNSSLRRLHTHNNGKAIANISSGLPLKGETRVVNYDTIMSEKYLRKQIKRNINKEIHSATKPSIDFIYKLMDDMYNSGKPYDVSDLKTPILTFAADSSHQSEYCMKKVAHMKFKSEDIGDGMTDDDSPIVFFDIEVYPNLFLVNYKIMGPEHKVIRLINPSAKKIEELCRYRLIGYNNRRYDNHILYGAMMGYSNKEIYNQSQRIVNKNGNGYFREAYGLSYTDVYDFASAPNKMSLKKWEIKLGIHHQEMDLPWDEPVPEHLWHKVAEYCDNDVLATEAVFTHLNGDWIARQILAKIVNMPVNTPTNTLSTKIIFGNNRNPQKEFCYRNLAEPVKKEDLPEEVYDALKEDMLMPMEFSRDDDERKSVLPYFPGYKFDRGKSTYKGVDPSEGGRVYSNPGIHTNVALLDIESMHPRSAEAELAFGPRYTLVYRELKLARVAIKHHDYDKARDMLEGILSEFLDDPTLDSKKLSNALKTVINSVYGLTSATFENEFRDPRNLDNIVAKRGALFMIDLQLAVEDKGFVVAHIKTDSIKIPNADSEIISFVNEFGGKYGYKFVHEATYAKMALVNKAVYIARYADPKECEALYGYIPDDNTKAAANNSWWTATGTQFAVPYVFKTLFSHEPIVFEDLCETKQATSPLYLDLNEQIEQDLRFAKELEIRNYNDVHRDDPNAKLKKNIVEFEDYSRLDLITEEAKNHDLIHVGKVGSFCPVLPNKGGGLLVREHKVDEKYTKYNAVVGTKGFRWLEAEFVKGAGGKNLIDYRYFQTLVDKAVEEISKYGDFEWFIAN